MTRHKNKNLNDPWTIYQKDWEKWCKRGRHGVGKKRGAAEKCRGKDGKVRGYYSDIILNSLKKYTDSLYPSIEHVNPKNNSEVVVEARIFNDMKSHLNEDEFWQAIEHLYCVGRDKGKIKGTPRRLPPKWHPKDY